MKWVSEIIKVEAGAVLKTKEFTFVIDCFQYKYNEEIGVFWHALIMKIKTLALSCILSLVTLNFYAQQSGKVDFPQIGLSFQVPQGWVGQEGDGVYFIAHNSIPGMVIIIPHSKSISTDEMITESSAGLQFSEGTIFKPIGDLSKFNENSMGGEFEGSYDYSPAKAFIIGMANPKGNGITIVSVTSSDAYKSSIYKELAMVVQSSVVFSAVEATNSSNESAASGTLKDWNYQLGDTKLTYMESYYSGGENGGGYNMTEEIHLCKAGYFLYYDQNFVAVGGSNVSRYSAGNSQGHGNWKIIDRRGTFVLALSFNDGTIKEYNLEWGEEYKLFLNGYRYYRTWEGDYAPDCFR